ncbi:MAG TPA: amidohydrolase family protein [Acidimicrobiia bacterium]|nr:amidohydrolase family protein [Acidimicrobiia bacterium]
MRPSLLADPPPNPETLVLSDVRLFDGTGGPIRDRVTVVVEEGRVAAVLNGAAGSHPGARVVDLGGRFLLPGLVDSHSHVAVEMPTVPEGAEPLRPGVAGYLAAESLRRALAMGITTVRDVGSYGDTVFELRQAMRLGAARGPRLLTCGKIVSATSPGGRHFEGMYREADGADDMRKAAREQLRAGADFVKIMMTGARSVELENPGPAQVTGEEVAALVDEAHRQGYRVAAHCEGLEGTRLAVDHGIDTIEHGFFLHQEPELLTRMGRAGQVLIPTLSFLVDVADRHASTWSPHLVRRGTYNLDEALKTVAAAADAGVAMAMGYDSAPEEAAASELALMVEAGLSPIAALTAATATGAMALGLDDVVGTVTPGKLADLLVVDADPVADIGVLADPAAIHLVLQLGTPVGGRALDAAL